MKEKIREYALSLGFDVVGFTTADSFDRDEIEALKRIDDNYMAGLPWYTKERVRKMNRPAVLLEDARSVISLATSYLSREPKTPSNLEGRIARYAWGDDYHQILKEKLRKFCSELHVITNRPVKTRIFVDDGPMNDRAAANRSGVGWLGKNTNIINPDYGSWVLLAQVITDLELPPDKALKKNCGSCVQCIIDCPTDAIVSPYVIDNRRCISYLTIELRGAIPRDMRPLIGDWVFGCDICQEVCPVNIKAKQRRTEAFQQKQGFSTQELIPILEMDQETFSFVYRASPIKRAKLVGLQRNACVALGNNGDVAAVPALQSVLLVGASLVRLHAAWALGRIGGNEAMEVLHTARLSEHDKDVLEEINTSLSENGEKISMY